MLKKFVIALLLFNFAQWAYSKNDEENATDNSSSATPPVLGNFALPVSQQPGPFFSFGQTLIGRNCFQLLYNNYNLFPNVGDNSRSVTALFGFTDATSATFTYPLNAENAALPRGARLTNLTDAILQFEHAVYNAGNSKYQDQATVVGAITFPLSGEGSLDFRRSHRNATLGFGASNYFLGATYNRTTVKWQVFASPGVLFITANEHTKGGNQLFYQAGLGRNILSKSEQYIFFVLLELNGLYSAKDKEFGRLLPDTGGNIISLAPSLWFSTQHLILQAGPSFPVVQHLYGHQTKTNYAVSFSVTWTAP